MCGTCGSGGAVGISVGFVSNDAILRKGQCTAKFIILSWQSDQTSMCRCKLSMSSRVGIELHSILIL